MVALVGAVGGGPGNFTLITFASLTGALEDSFLAKCHRKSLTIGQCSTHHLCCVIRSLNGISVDTVDSNRVQVHKRL